MGLSQPPILTHTS